MSKVQVLCPDASVGALFTVTPKRLTAMVDPQNLRVIPGELAVWTMPVMVYAFTL